MTEFLTVVAVCALALLLLVVRSLRIIGSKVSVLQSQQSKSAKEIGRQISNQRQTLMRITQLQALPLVSAEPRDWKFVVSLTSHAPRFHALPEVLEGLKSQVLQPQSILLNIALDDIAALPEKVKVLDQEGFIQIVSTDDLGPAKKLIPTLQSHKEIPIITIDDDLEFDSELCLHLMVQHYLFPQAIIASRVHQITFNSNGEVNRFENWNKQYVDSEGPAADLMPTSGAGTLYPPQALHPDATDADLYSQLSDFTDDLWWYFQGRRNGTLVRRISGFSDLNFIESTQEVGLWKNGNLERNESNLQKLLARYGNPLRA